MSPDSSGLTQSVRRVRGADGAAIDLYCSGRGPVLLLLHGWSLDHRAFAPQIAPLSRELTVITYDRRGFGASTAAPDLDAELGDIDAIMAALEVPQVHLLGVSQGGRLALRYAATRPQRLASLILQGAILDGYLVEESQEEQLPLAHYQALARQGRMDEVRRLWLAHPMMSAGVEDPALQREIRSLVADYSGADLMADAQAAAPLKAAPLKAAPLKAAPLKAAPLKAAPLKAAPLKAAPPDVMGALQCLHLPALVITGELETSGRKAHARKICELLRNSREIVMRHSGHLSNLTEAGRYNTEVLAFCREVESAD